MLAAFLLFTPWRRAAGFVLFGIIALIVFADYQSDSLEPKLHGTLLGGSSLLSVFGGRGENAQTRKAVRKQAARKPAKAQQ